MVLAGTAVLQAETRYFTSAEINSAWIWVRTARTRVGSGSNHTYWYGSV